MSNNIIYFICVNCINFSIISGSSSLIKPLIPLASKYSKLFFFLNKINSLKVKTSRRNILLKEKTYKKLIYVYKLDPLIFHQYQSPLFLSIHLVYIL